MMMYITGVYLCLFCILIPVTVTQVVDPTVKEGNKTVTAVLGGSVLLECQVINPGNNSVSWYYMDHNVRVSDNLDVLIDSNRYSIEQPKYAGLNVPGNRTVYFSLEIIHLKTTDQGHYQCQLEGIHDGKMLYELVIVDAERPTPPIDIPPVNHTACCLKEQVSAGCLPICDRRLVDPGFNPSLCSGDVIKLIKCGTDGRNHVSCCRRNLVPVECLDLCTTAVTSIRPDQLFCDQYDPQINGCFNEGQLTLPTPPREVTASPSPNGIRVDWLSPEENSDIVTGYRVSYRSVQKDSPTFQTTEILGIAIRRKTLMVTLGGLYQVYVTAISEHGSSQPSPVIELYSGPHSDVNSTQNVAIRECCASHRVDRDCQLELCNTRGYRSLQTLNVHYCQTDIPDIFHCIVGGQDHTTCCQNKGLSDQCMGLCSGHVIGFNETLLPCLLQLQKVEECLQEGFSQLPAAPQKVRLQSVGTKSAVLMWETAYRGSSPVYSYTVRYRLRTNAEIIPPIEIFTLGTFAILSPLRPDTVYEATVTSVDRNQSSLSTPTVIFQTYSEEPIKTDSPPENHQPVVPDMKECCQNKSVPSSCLWICSYDLDFHATLIQNRTELRACSPYIKEMLTCASDHRNHSECCKLSLVPDECSFMCTFASHDTAPNITAPCKEVSGNILNCYKSGVVSVPRSPVNMTVSNVTDHSISLHWDPDYSGPLPTDYVVQYVIADRGDFTTIPINYWHQETTNLTYHILQDLKADTPYIVRVVAVNENGSSIPREFIEQLTDIDQNTAIGFTTPGPGTTQHPLVIKPIQPPANRTECCETQGVDSDCLSVCEQGDITNTTCAGDIFSTLACSADGADHSSCCRRMGVPYACQGLCDGQTEHRNNPVSVLCASYADSIIYCTQRSSVAFPSQPMSFKIDQISSRSMRLTWDPPVRNCLGCTYTVYYSTFKKNYPNRRKNVPNIPRSPFRLSALQPAKLHEVYIIATNKQGFSQPSTKYLVWTRSEVPLQASISQIPEGIVGIGESVTLSCLFRGSPPPYSYKWYLHTHLIHHDLRYNINNVSIGDEGLYSCEIESDQDKDKVSHYLPMRYKPEVIYVSGDMVPPEQRYTAHFTCMFKGHPTDVKWFRDNIPLNNSRVFSQSRRELLDNGTTIAVMELGLITREDYGHYKCQGINDYGKADGLTDLINPETVYIGTTSAPSPSAPDLKACCMSNGVPEDQMRLCSSSIHNIVGTQRQTQTILTVLECAADERDSTKCCQKSRVRDMCLPLCAGQQVSTDSSLCSRSAVKIMDCLIAGQDALPSPPQNFSAHEPHLGEIVLTWSLPKKNPNKISFYHIYYHRMGDPSSQTKISVDSRLVSYTIDVNVQGVYQIWIVAGNVGGQSTNSSHQIVTVSNLLPSAPQGLHGQLIASGTISLTWNHPDVRTAPINNYVVFYRAQSDTEFKNKSTVVAGSSLILDNLEKNTEYKIFVRGNNTFGLGDISGIVYINTNDEPVNKGHSDNSGVNSVAVGVGVAVVLLVIIVIILLAIYYFKVRRSSLKEPGAVSFENPSYSEGNNSVQISGLRNESTDNTVHPPSATDNTTNAYDYGKLNDDGYSVPHNVDNPRYATLDVTQASAVNTQQISVSVDKDNSEA